MKKTPKKSAKKQSVITDNKIVSKPSANRQYILLPDGSLTLSIADVNNYDRDSRI